MGITFVFWLLPNNKWGSDAQVSLLQVLAYGSMHHKTGNGFGGLAGLC